MSPSISSNLPGNDVGTSHVSLFGLAPGGVYHAVAVTNNAVRSYRTLSPLPHHTCVMRRFTFCCTGREITLPRRYLAPCPMEPGLSSPQALYSVQAATVLANSATIILSMRGRSQIISIDSDPFDTSSFKERAKWYSFFFFSPVISTASCTACLSDNSFNKVLITCSLCSDSNS